MGPAHDAILYVSCKATPMINLRAEDITAMDAVEVAFLRDGLEGEED